MTLKTIYMIGLVVFVISIPAASQMDRIVFLARGYDKELIWGREESYRDQKKVARYYDAYQKETAVIVFCSWLIILLWSAMLAFSLFVIWKGVGIPFRLEFVTAAACVILLLVTAVPVLLFGKRWPPRPF
jgi:amino acid transporter